VQVTVGTAGTLEANARTRKCTLQ